MEKIRSFDEIQELGANRQFFDDFDYLMNGFDVSENNIFLAWDRFLLSSASVPLLHSPFSHLILSPNSRHAKLRTTRVKVCNGAVHALG